MMKSFETIKYLVSLLLPVSLLSACGGMTVRVFPEIVQPSEDISLELEYEATTCIPFVTCKYSFNLLGPGSWEMHEKTIIQKPKRITERYAEFSKVQAIQSSPGSYVLKGITIKYGEHSCYFTAINAKGYDAEDAANLRYENMQKYYYKRNLFSFVYYGSLSDQATSSTNPEFEKIPLRIDLDVSWHPRHTMHLPLPFERIGVIDLYLTDLPHRTDLLIGINYNMNTWSQGGWRWTASENTEIAGSYIHNGTGSVMTINNKGRYSLTITPGQSISLPLVLDTYENMTGSRVKNPLDVSFAVLPITESNLKHAFSDQLPMITRHEIIGGQSLPKQYAGMPFETWKKLQSKKLKSNIRCSVDQAGNLIISTESTLTSSLLLVCAWHKYSSGLYPYILEIQAKR